MKKAWETARLADVCSIIGGGTPAKDNDKYFGGDIPWATVRDMKNDLLSTTEFCITELALHNSSTNIIPKGNVIIATRVGLGKVCLLAQNTAINQDLKGIIPNSPRSLSTKYLFYWLKSVSNEIIAEGKGATVQGVTLPIVKNLLIPIPPLLEQNRIVKILDEAFEKIAKATENAKKKLENTSSLYKSYLQSILENNINRWEEKRLSEICEIHHGFAFDGQYFSNKGSFVLLTPGNFHEAGGYKDRGEKQKYYTGTIPNGYILSKGDLLVAMTEQAAGLLGSPIIVPESNKFLHNQRLGLVLEKTGIPWANEFFFHLFNLPSIREKIHADASGVKVRHTSPTKIGNIIVRFPKTVEEQKRIAKILEKLQQEIDDLILTYQKKIDLLGALRLSILNEAFNGNL